jgi:glyoxylase I family protein
MNLPISYTGIQHFALTITDMERSLAFYEKLGFVKLRELGPKTLIGNEVMVIGLEVAADTQERFDPRRVGLDHLSFQMASVADLEATAAYFDEQGIPHGDITDLSEHDLPLVILPFYDPDGIALEFTAVL